MCEGNNMVENIQHLKKSIAKMMVYWVVHTRGDLLEELLVKNSNNRWADLDLKNAFGESPAEASTAFNEFFSKASDLFNEPVVKAGANRIYQRVYGGDGGDPDWCDFLLITCPPNNVINKMFNAAMAFVDDTDWEGMTSVTP